MGLIGRTGDHAPLLLREAADGSNPAAAEPTAPGGVVVCDERTPALPRDRFEGVKAAAGRVGDAVDRSLKAMGDRLDRLDDAMLSAVQRPGEAIEALKETTRRTTRLLHVEERIRDLGPGDSYRLHASVDGSVAGIGGKVKGTQEITRTADGGFKLVVEGEAGAGLFSRIRMHGLRGQSSAFLNGGARVEFQFSTVEDTARAARAFMGPGTGAVSGWMEGGARAVIADIAFDPRVLRKNLTAIELGGGISAELAGELGLRGQLGAGCLGTLEGTADARARIELFEDGADQLVLRQRVVPSGKTTGHVGNARTSHSTICGIELAHRFDLPEGFDTVAVGRRPHEAVQQLAEAARTTGKLSVLVDAETQSVLSADPSWLRTSASHGGREIQLMFSGRTEEILASGGLQAALRGDLETALSLLSPAVETSVVVTPFQSHEFGLSWGVGVGVNSYGMDVRGRTIDREDPLVDSKGELQDARRLIEDMIKNPRVYDTFSE